MSISLTVAANSAAQFIGALDSGEALSAQQVTDAFAVANRLLLSWYQEQLQTMQELMQEQGNQGLIFLAQQKEVAFPLTTGYTLLGATYNAPTYTAPTITPGTAPQFADNTTPITLPGGYERAFVLSLGIELGPQYDIDPSDTLVRQAMEARAAANPMPNKRVVPGLSMQSGMAQGAVPPLSTQTEVAQ